MIRSISKKTYDFYDPSIKGYQIEYRSSIDDVTDWAVVCPSKSKTWIVNIHGHDAIGDQLFTHEPIRHWLDFFRSTGSGILCPQLRGNSWMSPSAAKDLHDLIAWLRVEYDARDIIFFGASMGGTSNLIYAVLYPEDVAAVVAFCPATDLSSFCAWCLSQPNGTIPPRLAEAIMESYGGSPDKNPNLFQKHSALLNFEKLTMPVLVGHGDCDLLIPVSQSRQLAEKMAGRPHFEYYEIPSGDHGAPTIIPQSREFLLQHGRF